MTVLEALKQAMDILNGISIPVPQLQAIGMPIDQAMGLIQASADAIEKNAKAEAAKEPEEPEETDEKPDEAEPV